MGEVGSRTGGGPALSRWPAAAGRWWLTLIWLLPALAMGWTVYRAPVWLEPDTLTIALEPGRTILLGREALRAPQADSEHVLLRREAGGGWRLANVATGKQVLWQPVRGGDERPVREWPLRAGAAFAVGGQSVAVLGAKEGRLALQAGGRRWEYDGFRLHLDGQPLPECYPDWRSRWRERLAELGAHGLIQRPLRLGGGVYCADRLGLAGVPVDTVVLALAGPDFVLRPGEAGRPDGPAVTVAAGGPEAESLWRRSVPLAVGDGLIIGRARYRVLRIAPALELAVAARARRWPAAITPRPATPPMEVRWRPVAWLWPSGMDALARPLSLALPLLALGLVWPTRTRGGRGLKAGDRCRIAGALALAGGGLGLYLSSSSVPVLWPYLLAWPALLLWLTAVRSPWSVGLLVVLTLLLGSGWVTLLQLGAGVQESGWSRFGGGAALAGAFGWLAWAGWSLPRRGRPADGLDFRWVRWGPLALGGAALVLLAAQAALGDEGGWSGFQPFELAKLALVLLAAHALTIRPGRGGARGFFRWLLSSLGPVLLLVAASGFALVVLRDFSPLVLLLLWALALAWSWLRAHSRASWRWGGRLGLLVLIGTLAAGAMGLRQWPDSFPLDAQPIRVRAWAAPEQYPHAGYQLRRALEAIRVGGWTGAVWSDAANGRVMTVPLVENDFTPTFFLNRYGGLAALLLVATQTAFVLLLLAIADRALGRTDRDDRRRAIPGDFAYFALCGGAALLGAHFLVSWGTNLGFLPVMGQPMSLLSSAGSHLLLFVLPVVALAVAVEEGNDDHPP
ncbi:MAG: FtsW/RodA/SpoVE family cell cycle protein [Candidatus Competibacter sp.]|nr:FtsW/RodA/SpoVE family cell cycle protein [Candidatus Competibacter sp.]MDG4583545.1 FtsW/RodA/SpoVE family cell cycle protein [Candidatus Competibacter sp.]